MNSTFPEFVLPPSDGSVSLDLAIDFHSEHNPGHAFAVLHNVQSRSQTTITYEQFAQAVHRAAHALNPGASLPRGTTLGILVSADSILYVTLVLGAIRAGLVPFPISPRTQVEGIARLFTQTQTSRVVTGGSPAVAGLYSQVESLLSEQEYKLESVLVPSLSDIYPQLSPELNTRIYSDQPFPTLQNTTPETTLVILHSSGSTDLPRPVLCDHEGLFKNVINQPMMKILGGPGARVGLMGLPTFHATGVFVQCMCSLYQGFTQVLFAPRHDPVVPTSDLTLRSLSDTECESAIAWPTFLEAWAQDEGAIAKLKKLRVILFGGGPLTERIGDQLVENGINIQIAYAGTEFGACTHPCPPGYDPKDWIYLKFSDQMQVQLVPQHDEQNSHEVFFLVGPENKPFVLNSEVDGKPAYSTKDLVVPHPSKPGLWKLVGRADDQITLSNGEKINPGPMENTILKSPLVQFAAVFGREKSQTGVLVDLTEDARGTYLNKGRTEIVENIWPSIEQANRISPTHARLAKDTIIFTVRDRPIPRTPKGNVSRPGALKAYSEEIENMYAALEKSGHVAHDVGVPEAWTNVSDVEVWVRSCVENVLGREVDVEGDLFQQGMDRRVQAAILLRTVKGTMHMVTESLIRGTEEKLDRNTIFVHPTVKRLARHLLRLCCGDPDNSASSDNHRASIIEEICSTIEVYNSDWSNRVKAPASSAPKPTKESVVLTGGTGGLGCHLLASLLADGNVERIWVLNRKSRDGALGVKDRQKAAFEDKLLNAGLLESHEVVMLEADLESELLGLEQETFRQIQSTVTAIIHNAWQVNFNLTLPSFAPSLKGTQNLLNLAFSSTALSGLPRFLFASSVSAAGFGHSDESLREEYVSLEHGIENIGYGRSKLVAEKLLESARASGLETCVVRLGQLTGDQTSGAWSDNDWVPSMIASSVSVGCLPTASGDASWIPLDTAARAIREVCMDRSVTLPPVIHCAHPQSVRWSDMIEIFAKVLDSRAPNGVKLEVVPFGEWNDKVIKASSTFRGPEDQKYRRFPSTKVQDVFDGMTESPHRVQRRGSGSHIETGGTALLDTTEGQKLSCTLKNAPKLGRVDVERWVAYWERRGLFS